MNTTKQWRIPPIKQIGTDNYEFILEDYELAFQKEQLKEITNDWNQGLEIVEISDKYKRHPHEVFLALFHQSTKEKVKRPFAYRM